MTFKCCSTAAVCQIFDYIRMKRSYRSLKYSPEVVYTRASSSDLVWDLTSSVWSGVCFSVCPHRCTSHHFFSCKTRQWIPPRHFERHFQINLQKVHVRWGRLLFSDIFSTITMCYEMQKNAKEPFLFPRFLNLTRSILRSYDTDF